jgi:D-amino peptidase
MGESQGGGGYNTENLFGLAIAISEEKIMKIYMLCDMEGISGIYAPEYTWFSKKEDSDKEIPRQGLKLLTDDINSASKAVLAAGVDELYVCDTHAGGHNVSLDDMISDLRISYEPPNRAELMPSLDETFDGLILLGHHAKAGTEGAFLSHTWTGSWKDFQINGMSVGEIGIETCYAGHWDVPLVMVQGDEACCEEAEEQFPGVVTAAVKKAIEYNKAVGPPLEEARRITAEKISEAVDKIRNDKFKPFKPKLPMTIHLTLDSPEATERIVSKPDIQRIAENKIGVIVERQCDILTKIVG